MEDLLRRTASPSASWLVQTCDFLECLRTSSKFSACSRSGLAPSGPKDILTGRKARTSGYDAVTDLDEFEFGAKKDMQVFLLVFLVNCE